MFEGVNGVVYKSLVVHPDPTNQMVCIRWVRMGKSVSH